jgi:deoxyribose-phosphate aldolase
MQVYSNMKTITEISKMIDHSLLHPTYNDDFLRDGCILAKELDVASVCIKPYAIGLAMEILEGSRVKVGTVIGFPHGNSSIDIKIKEAESACKAGAVEIDFVVNIGKVLSRDWDYIEREIGTINSVVVSRNAITKVIFENDYYEHDEYKIKLCEICNRYKPAFVKTSTGYGFTKQSNGMYSYKGSTDYDLKLMREHSLPEIQIKAAGGVRSLSDLLRVKNLGVTRVGATATREIIAAALEKGYV